MFPPLPLTLPSAPLLKAHLSLPIASKILVCERQPHFTAKCYSDQTKLYCFSLNECTFMLYFPFFYCVPSVNNAGFACISDSLIFSECHLPLCHEPVVKDPLNVHMLGDTHVHLPSSIAVGCCRTLGGTLPPLLLESCPPCLTLPPPNATGHVQRAF